MLHRADETVFNLGVDNGRHGPSLRGNENSLKHEKFKRSDRTDCGFNIRKECLATHKKCTKSISRARWPDRFHRDCLFIIIWESDTRWDRKRILFHLQNWPRNPSTCWLSKRSKKTTGKFISIIFSSILGLCSFTNWESYDWDTREYVVGPKSKYVSRSTDARKEM